MALAAVLRSLLGISLQAYAFDGGLPTTKLRVPSCFEFGGSHGFLEALGVESRHVLTANTLVPALELFHGGVANTSTRSWDGDRGERFG